ncbi:hypothetical protein PFLUV_G00011860 [Perca fluviatilis]|uniref:Uncharacterized protein n=2 Tax=Perca fluviatilis TaxID=8168 RepID=A0A6A5FS19_PERFL|nr:hypothetical protein PFLUV_G00011860 [Perca fluviatilis]
MDARRHRCRYSIMSQTLSKGKRFACINPKQNISDFPALKDCLPGRYDYHVCDYKTLSETGDHINYRAILRMALYTEYDIKLWLKSHTVTWRVDRTYPRKGQKVLFKVDFRCQRNTRPRNENAAGRRSQITNCSAKMTVTLLRTQVSRGRQSLSKDPHVPTFPTIVSICSDHNHNVYVADALSHCDVGDDTKAKLNKLFEAGRCPSSALDELKYDLSPQTLSCQSPSLSHQDAAAGFAEMCQELSAMVNSDASFTASSIAAVKAFKTIKDDPSKIMTALHMFGRSKNTSLASVRTGAIRRAARHAGPTIHAQPTAVARRPAKVTAGHDHVYSQPASQEGPNTSSPLSGALWVGAQKPPRMKE